jgi:hypothetical protein
VPGDPQLGDQINTADARANDCNGCAHAIAPA